MPDREFLSERKHGVLQLRTGSEILGTPERTSTLFVSEGVPRISPPERYSK
jgi:hypothetical protein